MALPALQSVADCADFSETISPFIPQLVSLPARIAEVYQDAAAAQQLYLTTNPLITAFFRLTFNYWRRGGYSIGSEDYRWQIVKSNINSPSLFFLLNVGFISFAQSILLFLVTAPTYIFILLGTAPDGPKYGIPDLFFSRLVFFFVIFEFFADQQQWNFQQAKKEYQRTARVPPEYRATLTSEDLDRGFVITGLWSWCRHPNYLAEQAVWLTLYAWASYKAEVYMNWTAVGAVSYILLFQCSTILGESITASKYPEYKDYQARVGKFLPRLF
ncbi:hypothetical protein FQN57_000417 [Myotisia sp. PD_48]|nr:hypothetical protein FQN57_000417 [Myotisia sp. PD_48]